MDETTRQGATRSVSLWLRSVAAVIDAIIVGIAWYYVIEVWGQSGSASGVGASATAGSGKILTGEPAILLMVATALYWILPEWILGSTPGKLVCGLQVLSMDSGSVSLGQSIKRNLLRLLDFFPFYITGFLVVLLTPHHQRLGDLWAKTVVGRREGKTSRTSY